MFLQRLEELKRAVFAPSAQFQLRQIPLGKSAAWFRRISHPSLQFATSRTPFRAIKLIQLGEDPVEICILRVVLYEIFQNVIAFFGRMKLQMSVRNTKEGGKHNRMSRAPRPGQDRLKCCNRLLRPMGREFETAAQKMPLFPFLSCGRPHPVQQTTGIRAVGLIEIQSNCA